MSEKNTMSLASAMRPRVRRKRRPKAAAREAATREKLIGVLVFVISGLYIGSLFRTQWFLDTLEAGEKFQVPSLLRVRRQDRLRSFPETARLPLSFANLAPKEEGHLSGEKAQIMKKTVIDDDAVQRKEAAAENPDDPQQQLTLEMTQGKKYLIFRGFLPGQGVGNTMAGKFYCASDLRVRLRLFFSSLVPLIHCSWM